MMKVTVYNQTGQNVKEIELNESVFGIEPHKQAMYDMVLLQRASLRQGTHKTKTRTEVRGGGRKPWRQKGTGNARQGSIRAPQWVGGGRVFGPTPRSYDFKVNRKVRRLALRSALSYRVLEEGLKVIDQISFDAPKTKSMISVLEALSLSGKTLLVLTEGCENVYLSARNLPGVEVMLVTDLNVYDVLHFTNLIMSEAAIQHVEEVLA